MVGFALRLDIAFLLFYTTAVLAQLAHQARTTPQRYMSYAKVWKHRAIKLCKRIPVNPVARTRTKN